MVCGKGRGEVPVGLLEQAGRFAGPALRGDGDTEVMQGQADLGVAGTEHRLEDPERPQAEGFGLCIVILVAGQHGQVRARHGHLEMIRTIGGLEDHQRFAVGGPGLIETPGLVIQGAKRVQVPPRVGVIVSHCFDPQGQTSVLLWDSDPSGGSGAPARITESVCGGDPPVQTPLTRPDGSPVVSCTVEVSTDLACSG